MNSSMSAVTNTMNIVVLIRVSVVMLILIIVIIIKNMYYCSLVIVLIVFSSYEDCSYEFVGFHFVLCVSYLIFV